MDPERDPNLLLAPCTPLGFSTAFSLPPASAFRAKREVSLLDYLPGPYQQKPKSSSSSSSTATQTQVVLLSNAETRWRERVMMERRRPVSSVKVRGGESFAMPPPPPPTSSSMSRDEHDMSLVVIGSKSCLVDASSDRYVDPELLFCRAPGLFSSSSSSSNAGIGLTLAQAQLADEQMRKELERKKRQQELDRAKEEEKNEEEKNEEEEENEPAAVVEDTVLAEVAPYPDANPSSSSSSKNAADDEYTAMHIQPWSVLDESDVSDFHSRVPRMAIEYPFELDVFQKRAVLHLERGESVFAAAHTSAGKTVIAEYAIALAFEHRTRLVYTSPIKALSNQKFRDFSDKFGPGKVGLLTGDNSVNPDAACVVMTTEILRSMLYRGAEMIRDVEFVVFDEIHYVNDADRGVIWEEVIIMLPQHVHVIMLSATTPNTMEFSAWVGRNRREQVFVVSTFKRPVPLEHYLYCGPGQRFLLMDNTGRFFPDAHKQATVALRSKDPFAEVAAGNRAPGSAGANALKRESHFTAQRFQHSATGGGSRNSKTGENRWLDLVKDLKRQELLPVIIFTFSKKQVETRAACLLKLDLLNSNAEKSRVHVIMHKALTRLQVQDRELPQIKRVQDLLLRGIGIHHGGLLPILKEVVEICFTNGLVRALIATETFAMGVNAPCRTVCFGGLKKHDGVEYRALLPGEYIQMAGRSGRRGIDSVGSVIIHCEDDVPPLDVLSRMLTGKSSQLESRFRLRYSMILNLLRTDELSVADMIKRSFSEFSTLAMRSQKQVEIKRLKKDLARAKRVFAQIGGGGGGGGGGSASSGVSRYHAALHSAAKTVTRCVADLLTGRRGQRAQEWTVKPGRLVQCTLADLNLFSVRAVVCAVVNTSNSNNSSSTATDELLLVCCAKLPEGYKPHSSDDVFKLPKQSLEAAAAAATPMPPGKSAAAALPMKAKRKFDDDDDDEFTVKKPGKKGGGGGGNSAAAPSLPAVALTYDVPPRALFGDGCVLFTLSLRSATAGELELVSNVLVDLPKPLQDRIMSKQRVESDVAQAAATATAGEAAEDDRLATLQLGELKVTDFEVLEMWSSAERVRSEAALEIQSSSSSNSSSNSSSSRLGELRQLAKDVHQLDLQLFALLKETSDESLALFPDFQARLHVLHLERMLNEDGVELKGRVACEINTCDELLLTEMVFDNLFDDLDAAECCALLSALVLQAKTSSKSDGGGGADEAPTPALERAWRRTVELAERLNTAQTECGVALGTDDWVSQVVNPGMLRVTYEWARGVPFASLMQLTELEEGTIVRCITRLDETCREVKNVSRLIGNPQLLIKMETASQLIKRDIVFATSLYVG